MNPDALESLTLFAKCLSFEMELLSSEKRIREESDDPRVNHKKARNQ